MTAREQTGPPTLADVVHCASELAFELREVLVALPDDLGSPEPRPVQVLRTQASALRAMDADASGFWARRQTWALGQTAVVVVPPALRGLQTVAAVEPAAAARCTALVTTLATVLEHHASGRPLT